LCLRVSVAGRPGSRSQIQLTAIELVFAFIER